MNVTETLLPTSWSAYGTLIITLLTLAINLHQSFKSKHFQANCSKFCETVYEMNYQENDSV